MKKKISVIVPIYKVEKYIHKCIDSILEQTYTNFELILVDDGSPDKCGQICDEYARKDKRIIALHKKNGGLSDARNYGMKYATGDYIAFIDSDDYIEKDYLSILYEMVDNGNDIGILLPQPFYEETEPKKCLKNKYKSHIYNSKKALEIMLYQKKFDTSAWGKIYKRNLWKNVEFPVGKIYEDISTIYKLFLKSNKVAFANIRKYYYLQRKTSIMGQSFSQKDLDYISQAQSMLENIEKTQDKKLIKAARTRYINANFSILLKLKNKKQNIEERKFIKRNIKEYRLTVLLNNKSRLKTKIGIILNYFNII